MLKYRPLNELDKFLLEKWIAQDPEHHDDPVEFWTASDDGKVQCFAVEDDHGAIFYVRAENVLRLHIQFAPPNEKGRTARTIVKFAENIAHISKDKYKQLIFESVSKPLTSFLEKLGFKASPNEWKKDI